VIDYIVLYMCARMYLVAHTTKVRQVSYNDTQNHTILIIYKYVRINSLLSIHQVPTKI